MKSIGQKPPLLTRYLWLAGGHIALLLGVIGIFLPLLPTTPFLLLTAFCYSNGSEAFERWLLNHKYLGPPIKEWRQNRVIKPRAKAVTAILISMSIIWVWTRDNIPLPGKIAMLAVVLPALLFVLSRKSSADKTLE